MINTIVPSAKPPDLPSVLFSEDLFKNSNFARLEKVNAKGPVLRAGPAGQGADVKSLELLEAEGGSHSSLPFLMGFAPNAVIKLVANAAERLEEELAYPSCRPRAVHICPSSDPFLFPLELQRETARVVAVLARHGVQSWLMTRGPIRHAALDILARHKDLVKVRIGLSTLDRRLCRALEPNSFSPRLRLRQIKKLRARGIVVHVALEPLVAGLTDDRLNLLTVLEALAETGIRQITAGYLALPVGSEAAWQNLLEPQGLESSVMDSYTTGPVLRAGRGTQIRYLPKSQRQQGYALLMTLAAPLGISVTISAASNPDFARPAPAPLVVQPCLRFSSLTN